MEGQWSANQKKSCQVGKLNTYSRWEIPAGLEFLQGHGACVGAQEEDASHEGDVRNKFAVVACEESSILQTLLLCQGGPVNRAVVL